MCVLRFSVVPRVSRFHDVTLFSDGSTLLSPVAGWPGVRRRSTGVKVQRKRTFSVYRSAPGEADVTRNGTFRRRQRRPDDVILPLDVVSKSYCRSNTVELRYNRLGYNEYSVITDCNVMYGSI